MRKVQIDLNTPTLPFDACRPCSEACDGQSEVRMGLIRKSTARCSCSRLHLKLHRKPHLESPQGRPSTTANPALPVSTLHTGGSRGHLAVAVARILKADVHIRKYAVTGQGPHLLWWERAECLPSIPALNGDSPDT